MSRKSEVDVPRHHLPPREFWTSDLEKIEKYDTPLNVRGLVDTFTVVNMLRSHIVPEYKWSSFRDRHHEYYEGRNYQNDPLEQIFRNLPINLDRIPRDAHELWHYLFLPPKKPDRELMTIMNEAYDVTTGLFNDAREVIRLRRHKKRLLSQSFRIERGKKEFRSVSSREKGINFHQRRFEDYLERYEALPPEGVLAEVDVYDELPSIARKLGATAIIRSPMRNLSSLLQTA